MEKSYDLVFWNDPDRKTVALKLMPDMTAEIHGVVTNDPREIGKAMMSWYKLYLAGLGYQLTKTNQCDCGAVKANTTHVNWCATNNNSP